MFFKFSYTLSKKSNLRPCSCILKSHMPSRNPDDANEEGLLWPILLLYPQVGSSLIVTKLMYSLLMNVVGSNTVALAIA